MFPPRKGWERVEKLTLCKEFCKFCQETEKELWTLFTSIDKDNNGRLDKGELAAAFERSGVGVSNARLDRFFSYIDTDRDGSIDYNEWRGSCQSLSSQDSLNSMLTSSRLPFVYSNAGARTPRRSILLPIRRAGHARGGRAIER